jgi:hypothetical protein
MYINNEFVWVWQGYGDKENVPTTGKLHKILKERILL